MPLPDDILAESLRIIDAEAGPHEFDRSQWEIVRRMIQATADFDYKETVRFHPQAIETGIRALRSGKHIITDTPAVKSCIRQDLLARLGGTVTCVIDHPKVVELSRVHGTSPACIAVDAVATHAEGGIYVVGEEPAALGHLLKRITKKVPLPSLIIGLPVGFVNAVETKRALIKTDFPHISNIGRKGGAAPAAGAVNGIIQLALEKA